MKFLIVIATLFSVNQAIASGNLLRSVCYRANPNGSVYVGDFDFAYVFTQKEGQRVTGDQLMSLYENGSPVVHHTGTLAEYSYTANVAGLNPDDPRDMADRILLGSETKHSPVHARISVDHERVTYAWENKGNEYKMRYYDYDPSTSRFGIDKPGLDDRFHEIRCKSFTIPGQEAFLTGEEGDGYSTT